MSDKNWLIRTRNKQILGPATKQKVIELIEKGSLSGDDEVTSGNGYWFWIRERDLIDKYLYGDLPQSFNPISEAEDVLTAKSTPDGVTESVLETPQPKIEEREEDQLPSDGDLEYPDDGDLEYPDEGDLEFPEGGDLDYPDSDDHSHPEEKSPSAPTSPTMELEVEELNTAPSSVEFEEETEESGDEGTFLYPDKEDLEYPESYIEEVLAEAQESEEVIDETDDDSTDPNVSIPEVEELENSENIDSHSEEELIESQEVLPEAKPEKKTVRAMQGKKKAKKKKKRKVVTERKGNDRYLFIILFLVVAAIGVVFYYYKEVLNKPFPIIGIRDANAQMLQSLSKKKSF